jgi:hypothetical protein
MWNVKLNTQVSILFFPSTNKEVCIRCRDYFYPHGRRMIITTEQIFTQNEALPQRSLLPEIVKFLSSQRTAEGPIQPVSGDVAELVAVIRDKGKK